MKQINIRVQDQDYEQLLRNAQERRMSIQHFVLNEMRKGGYLYVAEKEEDAPVDSTTDR